MSTSESEPIARADTGGFLDGEAAGGAIWICSAASVTGLATLEVGARAGG